MNWLINRKSQLSLENKIFEIETIQGARVKIENVRSKLIPQCRHCQGYGHTQKYYNLQPKCVKCAGDHDTKQCTKGDLRTPKCANCLKNHPANYRGCEIAKKKQKEKNDILRKKATIQAEQQEIGQQHRRNFEIRTEIKEKRVPQKDGHTYAQIAGGKPRKETELPEKDILQKIMEKLEQQEKENKIIKEKIEKIENTERNVKRATAQRNFNG
jgi:hypothetical protein